MSGPAESLAGLLAREHRRLDDLFGRFLGAAQAGHKGDALVALEEFDEALRAHTALEEEHLFPAPSGHRLAPPLDEEERERLFRELRLEHVQIREVSGMIARLLSEKQDLEGARRLAPNLARRWDGHTEREEREVFSKLETLLDASRVEAVRNALGKGKSR